MADGFSGKPTPPWPAGKARLRCRGAVLRALFRRGGVGQVGGLVRICSASAAGALGPQHLGGVFLVENFVAVAAFKCLLDHGGLLFRRGMRFGRAAVRASCPLHGKVRLLFLENAKGLVGVALEVWRTWSWRFGGHGVGYAASGLAGVASACRLRPGGRCGKCLVFEMLAVLARPRGRDA